LHCGISGPVQIPLPQSGPFWQYAPVGAPQKPFARLHEAQSVTEQGVHVPFLQLRPSQSLL
jgi:hypothetical protein